MSVMLINALSARQGGGQTYLINLLSRLPPGEPSTIYLLAPDAVGETLASERVRLLKPRWPVANPVLRALWETLFLRRHAATLGATVLFFPGGVIGGGAPAGCRRVTMFRNMLPFDPAMRARYPLGYHRLRNWILRRVMLRSMLEADLVIFLSGHARAVIEHCAGRALRNAVTIPHGIDPAFRATSAPGLRPDWLPKHPYLLHVSTLDYYKTQVEVVRAFARVLQGWKGELSLVLLGPENPSYGRLVRAEIGNRGLANRVLLPGPKPYRELPHAYRHAVVNIFASESENCPNILLEAMAAGKPIVCSSRAPMPEFGGDAVWYFDPADVDALAQLLLRLLQEPESCVRLGEAAAERSKRFDWDETARATWTAIRKLDIYRIQ